MPAAVDQHHHRSTTQSGHKPFKSRFASKNALKDKAKGKTERFHNGPRKTPHQQVMSKFDRKNQAKQKRVNKLHEHGKVTNIFAGRDSASRIVAVVPLTEDINSQAAVTCMNSSLDIEEEVRSKGSTHVYIERFKQSLCYFLVERDLFRAMDACRAADYVLFVLSAKEEVDAFGENMLRCIESQGVPQVYVTVQGLETIESAKRKTQIVTSLKSFFTHFFPAQDKVFNVDSRQDCLNLMRSLCTTTPKGIKWREDRSWMLVEDVQWTPNKDKASKDGDDSSEVRFTGVIRGRGLKADRLLQVGDWGDFQIDRITSAPLERLKKRTKENEMPVDSESNEKTLDAPSAEQDDLQDLAPLEAVMNDVDPEAASTLNSERKGVLLDGRKYMPYDDDGDEMEMPKSLPKGTSAYQSAWYLGDASDSDSDLDDMEDAEGDIAMVDSSTPADGPSAVTQDLALEMSAEDSEYPESEMFIDRTAEEEAEDLATYRANRKTEAEEDREFPDEIELHPNVSARERLAKYRGLTSLKTSPWDTDEDKLYEPEGWNRLLEINNYQAAKSSVMREALVGGVKPGTRVHVYVRNVPNSLQNVYDPAQPFALFSLLRHEHKRTAAHYTITLDTAHPEPLKSKDELLMVCGPRRMLVRPLFSQPGNTPNDVHKFERYLHPGRTAVASFTAPLVWGAAPAVFLARPPPSNPDASPTMDASSPADAPWRLAGRGTTLPASTRRIVAKRAVLTGAPYRINRRLVTVRYMFFDADDVAWFRALPLWTNRGRQGVIKESLGTHGYFKAMFDARIAPQDAVGVSLYKRVWPRPARVLTAV